jgi:hypothetical protein
MTEVPEGLPLGGLSIEEAAGVHEMIGENPGVTPDEVMDILELDEKHRDAVEAQCAITRLIRFGASHGGAFDDRGLNWENVEWSDVKEWPVAKSAEW